MPTEIWKLNGLLDEKHRYVVPNNIPIPLVCVKFHCKATHVSDGIRTALASLDSGEANKYGSITRSICQNSRRGEVFGTLL